MDAMARSLLPRSSVPANGSCPWEPSFDENASQPIFGNITFYHFNVYLSGACAIVAAVVIYILMFLHGTHLSRPAEQVKIIRIANLIPAYSMISWFSILVPSAYYYLSPWLDVIQAMALANFFLLLCELISPNEDQRSLFFAAMEIPSQRDRKTKSMRHYDTVEKKLFWYRRKWIAIFQYPVVALFVAIVTTVTQAIGRYCDDSFNPKFAHLWMVILDNISVSLAVTAIFLMYQVLKVQLRHHMPLAKLGAFKIIVGLAFIQGIIFAILQGAHALNPNDTLTYADFKVGIPTLLTCLEMVPIAFFFHFAYSWKPYTTDPSNIPVPLAESKIPAPSPVSSYQGGFLGYRAYLAALSPMEVIEGVLFAFKMFNEHKRMEQSMEGNYGSALEPLRQNAASPSGHPQDEGHGPTYGGYSEGQQHGTVSYGAHNQAYNGYSYGNNATYGQQPQGPSPYRGAPPQQLGVSDYATDPSVPYASHSRSQSRNGEAERLTGKGGYDNGA